MSEYVVQLTEQSEPISVEVKEYDKPPILEGTTNYLELLNKPQINGITLEGNKSSEDIGIEEISNTELEALLSAQI